MPGTADASPILTKGSEFEQHLERKTRAAQEFHAADAKNIIKMASRARTRALHELYPGQIVNYFRRGKKKEGRGYRGPAKAIAIEKGQGSAPVVAWLCHGGTLRRAAPDRLRMATPLETRSLDLLADMGNVTADMPGQR